MALNQSAIVISAMSKLQSKGFVIDNEHSKQRPMVEAIVEAIVEGIKSDAKAIDSGGTAPGEWSIE